MVIEANEKKIFQLIPSLNEFKEIFYGDIEYESTDVDESDKANLDRFIRINILDKEGEGDVDYPIKRGKLRIHFKPHQDDPQKIRGKDIYGYMCLPSPEDRAANEKLPEQSSKGLLVPPHPDDPKIFVTFLKDGTKLPINAIKMEVIGTHVHFYNAQGELEHIIDINEVKFTTTNTIS